MAIHECPVCHRTVSQGWSWRRAVGMQERGGLCATCAARARAERLHLYYGPFRFH
jgi:hypothetical protein